MPDIDVLEKMAKEHPEIAEQIAEQAEAQLAEIEEPKRKAPVKDSAGNQLRFDGLDITDVEDRLVGDLSIKDGRHVDLDETRTFEVVAIHYKTVIEKKKGKGGKPDEITRVQMYKPVDMDSVYIKDEE